MLSILQRAWPALTIALLATLALLPGITGPFLLDDLQNIANHPYLNPDEWNWQSFVAAVATNDSSPLGRPVAAATFALNAIFTGTAPLPMKLTNVVLHGLAAISVLLLATQLISACKPRLPARQRDIAALFVAAAWALHPIAITSTLYAVQRMNLLAALFTVLSLIAFLAARRKLFSDRRGAAMFALAGACAWFLGVFSKETALLLPLYLLVIEYVVFQFRDDNGRLRKELTLAWAGLLALAVIATVITMPYLLQGYEARPFTVMERLLTEPRVLWHYVEMIFVPSHYSLGLYQDDISLSAGLFKPWTTVVGITALVAVAVGALLARKRVPLLSLGILLFLAGHALESTFLPLEIAFEHRNYLPSFGLLLGVFGTLASLEWKTGRSVILALLLAWIAYFSLITTLRAIHWGDEFLLAQLEAQHHTRSARAQCALAGVYAHYAEIMDLRKDSGWSRFYRDAAETQYTLCEEQDPEGIAPLFARVFLAGRFDGGPEEQQIDALADHLASEPPAPSWPSYMAEAYKCLTLDTCHLSDLQFEYLLRTALGNQKLKGRVRSEILVLGSLYFKEQKSDNGSAAVLLKDAVAATPDNPRFRVYLAATLAGLGDFAAAERELHTIAQLDDIGVHDKDVAGIREFLQKHNQTSAE